MGQYGIGDRVTQAQYGDGTVTRADANHTIIDFDGHGPRTFVSGRVVLAQATTAAPAKKPRRVVRKPKVKAEAPVATPDHGA
jgi:hypothetical protein